MLCDSCKDIQRTEEAGNQCSCKKAVPAPFKLCIQCAKSKGKCRCCGQGLHLTLQAVSAGLQPPVAALLRFA